MSVCSKLALSPKLAANYKIPSTKSPILEYIQLLFCDKNYHYSVIRPNKLYRSINKLYINAVPLYNKRKSDTIDSSFY